MRLNWYNEADSVEFISEFAPGLDADTVFDSIEYAFDETYDLFEDDLVSGNMIENECLMVTSSSNSTESAGIATEVNGTVDAEIKFDEIVFIVSDEE